MNRLERYFVAVHTGSHAPKQTQGFTRSYMKLFPPFVHFHRPGTPLTRAPLRTVLLVTCAAALSTAHATTGTMTPERRQCQPAAAPIPTHAALPRPSVVTGNSTLYIALYDARGVKTAEVVQGNADQTQPLASAYKTMVVYATLKAVDEGKLTLTQQIQTTAENRSIEDYPRGRNSVQTLAGLAIQKSDNTASDILHLAVTPRRVTELTAALSPCTAILLTSKGQWSAMAGLTPRVIPGSTPQAFRASAQRYGALPLNDRLTAATSINTAAKAVNADQLLSALDRYFTGPAYHIENDLNLYNTSTARAYADLSAQVMRGNGQLTPATQALFRRIMSTGCCTKPTEPMGFKPLYWGAKAGSGWGLLTMSGYMELPDGRSAAYTYINHGSQTLDSEVIERQIRPVLNWVVANINLLRGKTAP